MATVRLEPGSLLGDRYEILETVGRGGMGTVYRARDRRLDAVVAIKELIDRGGDEAEREVSLRQFEREARLLAQLSHRNLPRVTDYFIENERCYLAMEYVEGETLESILRRFPGHPIPLPQALEWASQIADVLSYLHGQDPPVVFRDLKPANVMLTRDGTIKLIDFGIARRFQEGATKDTLLYGSPGYSPPEQYGRSQTDPRSDVYAFGATLHHLVTGRDPAPTPFKYPAVRSLVPSLPPLLESLIAQCLEMDVEKRIQTAEELRRRLNQIRALVGAHGGGVGAREASAPQPKVRSGAMLWAGLAAIVLLALVGGVAGVVALRSAAKPPPPPPAPLPAPPVEEPPGRLHVTSSPEGARIWVDGREVGTTPAEVTNVEPGLRIIRLTPPEGSAAEEKVKEVQVRPGETVVLDVSLGRTTPAPPQPAVALTAASASVVRDPALGEAAPPAGVRITASLRISGAAGKPGAVSAFFFQADGITPLRPRVPDISYQNEEGHLGVARSFEVASDPAELRNVELFVPATAFPQALDTVMWQLMVYVEGRLVFRSEPAAIR